MGSIVERGPQRVEVLSNEAPEDVSGGGALRAGWPGITGIGGMTTLLSVARTRFSASCEAAEDRVIDRTRVRVTRDQQRHERRADTSIVLGQPPTHPCRLHVVTAPAHP